jgi:NAD-dependent epimerase/dehydratase family protein
VLVDEVISSEDELDEALSRPGAAVVEELAAIPGDLIVLGAGGKMGPTLARMARRAFDRAGSKSAVIAVARFSNGRARAMLERAGVRTISCDLLNRSDVERLPDAAAAIFMAGAKFGTTGAEAQTWASNCYAPALAAERYAGRPTVVFSTGNVYPLVAVAGGGATEETPPAPVGDYAQSALGRERIFDYFSQRRGTPATIYRLNYAVELRYGVLLDIARKVWSGAPIDLRMGYVNCLWQGDANALALRCLSAVRSPPFVLNVTGAETTAVRTLARRFGELFGRAPILSGEEEPTALLSNAARARGLFGPPEVDLGTVIEWVADWVRMGGSTLDKPTHFETRDGRF